MTNKIYIEPASSERDHRKLEALGRKLGLPVPMAFLEMEVTMPGGKVIHYHKQRSHSWVRNSYNTLFCIITGTSAPDAVYGAGNLNIKDLSGTIRSGGSISMSSYMAAVASTTHGILVGSGVNVESFEDSALQTPITNGNGAGQLNYLALDPYVKSYNGGTKTFTSTFVRYMNNNSSGNVAVNEVLLATYGYVESGVQRFWAMSRDHLAATVTVPATGQLKVTHIISLVYPA